MLEPHKHDHKTVTQGGSIKHIVTNYWFMGVFGVKKIQNLVLNGNQNLC